MATRMAPNDHDHSNSRVCSRTRRRRQGKAEEGLPSRSMSLSSLVLLSVVTAVASFHNGHGRAAYRCNNPAIVSGFRSRRRDRNRWSRASGTSAGVNDDDGEKKKEEEEEGRNDDESGSGSGWATATASEWETDAAWSDEWSSSSSSSSTENDPGASAAGPSSSNGGGFNNEDFSESWLDALASISAEEIEFNRKENDRADKVFRMQEWGFDDDAIKNAFSVEVDDELETRDELDGMRDYRTSAYDWEEELADAKAVESHATVERDPVTGETIRQQMVYVDEHSCIGCTNCAMIADSTFFMEDDHGRARVFEQWGDTEETIATAIETCPVDCIHYVPFEELVALETERRGQRINAQARLVNQGESAHMASSGGNGFTGPQKISGNAGSRCNNCPSRGCKTCPMFGVGKNPAFEAREAKRLSRMVRNQLDRERRDANKAADL